MQKHIVFIVNPIAGKAPRRQALPIVMRRLIRAGHRVQTLTTEASGHAEELSRGLPDDVDLIVAVGGDGTIGQVAAGRVHTPIPIAIFPAGTENIIARYYGFRPTADALCHAVLHGVNRPIDIARANGRHFLLVAGGGFDAACVARVTQLRRGHLTKLDYTWPVWRTFWEYPFTRIRVCVDDKEAFHDHGIFFVGNISQYSLRIPILRDAEDDDGLLDVCVMRCRHQASLLVHALFTVLGRHVERSSVIYRQARRIHIESDGPLPLQVDGDVSGLLPVTIEVVPHGTILATPPEFRPPSSRTHHRHGAIDPAESRTTDKHPTVRVR